ncbi:MAG: Ion transport 2 domain protein [Candidatus Peribacter riflensis]|uniref:Ion transport 2 domain protein n=1 Tax=Candidatus Peribacter riflensis TaxID=1735162 RepID=A0A0S1SPV6_9BACT|nr:MAG: Ion transport 2 domain protein [Candidatus Peribacter riflensis]ALM12327.1 MAG: Ion transport 2 domain protein [Candidatus Peribacter riflensis]ALM13429.1 MAG: Ion transport 2 domain protein [Candidatus Peribacter riflensis]OGJ77808.1 MAG: hypothetical protein A2398_00865 [Candidatus Peribacteria bacterium RIFOXYB1_FULL_57_12]OGJ80349.1 MAG: hypothetical protein A2412_01610 [Candidatus Peribacteria bacterium RIFOXYC1_FULL_58_8]
MQHGSPNNGRPRLHQRLAEKIITLPYTALFSLWFVLAALFAAAYALLAVFAPEHAPQALLDQGPLRLIGNSLYYSVITSTTTGYGDIVPMGFSKFLSCIQSVVGFFLLAVFVTKLVSQQQELAVRQMHKLTYEDVFHNTREGLFVIRNDFDRLIQKVEQREPLTLEDWDDLAIAFKQGQSLLLEIPEFYSPEEVGLYTIDERREQLLQEAVHRTLHRINQLIDGFGLAGIDWTAHQKSAQELKEFLSVVGRVAPLWHARSPYAKNESFEMILRLKERAMNRMKHAA